MLTALFAVIAMRRVHVGDEDLELAEMGFRGAAKRIRQDAERQANPIVREGFIRNAEHFERIADRMKRSRNDGG